MQCVDLDTVDRAARLIDVRYVKHELTLQSNIRFSSFLWIFVFDFGELELVKHRF